MCRTVFFNVIECCLKCQFYIISFVDSIYTFLTIVQIQSQVQVQSHTRSHIHLIRYIFKCIYLLKSPRNIFYFQWKIWKCTQPKQFFVAIIVTHIIGELFHWLILWFYPPHTPTHKCSSCETHLWIIHISLLYSIKYCHPNRCIKNIIIIILGSLRQWRGIRWGAIVNSQCFTSLEFEWAALNSFFTLYSFGSCPLNLPKFSLSLSLSLYLLLT